jgi:iron(III) transport system ATP-binding protein
VAQFLGEAVLLSGEAAGSVVRCELGELPLAVPATGPVTVLLRPEQIVPTTLESGHPGPAAEVTALSFHGHDALIGLRTTGGTALAARVLGGWLPRPGDRVALTVHASAWPLPG